MHGILHGAFSFVCLIFIIGLVVTALPIVLVVAAVGMVMGYAASENAKFRRR